MINFNYETNFSPIDATVYSNWIISILESENFILGNLEYIFCDDAYLLKINQEYLNHDTFTDIITFDYSEGKTIGGDIFISIERVKENASNFNVNFTNELQRIMAHGILHLLGFKDKTKEESLVMRKKEEEKIKMFHVEQ
ncbi:rRNA maturation RNase YbeY [Maribacter vaceletii]|uniref:Endoribonuclease YbeY n=1 Tax=Maribacter vaceletii TaxID=1206816 RepID=A0A495ED44_9FLAO|nr:rRNA maturation RNase YbeY [Maribacter vaceletii]RKR14805.1 rRNA maturation RNase YbeY [Maribacter vaceletii]